MSWISITEIIGNKPARFLINAYIGLIHKHEPYTLVISNKSASKKFEIFIPFILQLYKICKYLCIKNVNTSLSIITGVMALTKCGACLFEHEKNIKKR